MPLTITADAFVGRRHTIERSLICAMQGQFPVLARGAAGELVVVFRTGAGHYGLSGTLATAWSIDAGRTWSAPIEVAPRGDDFRNPALGVDAAGAWILAYWQAGVHCYPVSGGERRWQTPAARPAGAALDAHAAGAATHAQPSAAPDAFFVVSHDRGRTWSAPSPLRSRLLSWLSPFGRIIAAPDGALLMPAYGRAGEASQFEAIVLRSRDGGATWGDESLVLAQASELSLCVVDDCLVGAVRRPDGHTAIVRSADLGRTWSEPIAATRTGEHPADLWHLAASRRLLLTFGRRRRPLGCGALTSGDGGLTWDTGHEALLAGDGIGHDVGYPSTVQTDDGTLVTALYFAHGSAASEPSDGWGETSCQALRYPEVLVVPPG